MEFIVDDDYIAWLDSIVLDVPQGPQQFEYKGQYWFQQHYKWRGSMSNMALELDSYGDMTADMSFMSDNCGFVDLTPKTFLAKTLRFLWSRSSIFRHLYFSTHGDQHD